jgi:ribose 1,5-bisphosphokinase
MGPSGAGKDTVLRCVRAQLAPGEKIAFAHRYITRPPDPRHENFVTLNEAEFDTRRQAGLFAFDWRAHGFRYAVGIEIEAWRRAGFLVVVSGSRGHFKSFGSQPRGLFPILITAPPEVLADRLAARGREDAAARAARIERNAALTIEDPTVTRIDNTGAAENAAAQLLAVLRGLAARPEEKEYAIS